MTTEEAGFHTVLDANLDDWLTRAIFADWLQDRDDPRAAGYRALSELCKRPYIHGESVYLPDPSKCYWGRPPEGNSDLYDKHRLPIAWFDRLTAAPFRTNDRTANLVQYWKLWGSRREAEDAAAIAYRAGEA